MPAIAIRGIRIKSMSITPSADEANEKLTCTYLLISTADKVLAEQQLNGYGGMKLSISSPTQKLLDAFMQAFKNEIQLMLGLDADA